MRGPPLEIYDMPARTKYMVSLEEFRDAKAWCDSHLVELYFLARKWEIAELEAQALATLVTANERNNWTTSAKAVSLAYELAARETSAEPCLLLEYLAKHTYYMIVSSKGLDLADLDTAGLPARYVGDLLKYALQYGKKRAYEFPFHEVQTSCLEGFDTRRERQVLLRWKLLNSLDLDFINLFRERLPCLLDPKKCPSKCIKSCYVITRLSSEVHCMGRFLKGRSRAYVWILRMRLHFAPSLHGSTRIEPMLRVVCGSRKMMSPSSHGVKPM